MRLADLLKNIYDRQIQSQFSQFDIQSICSDSRKAERNCLFIALNGTKNNGADYIPDAIAKGAAAVVHEFLPQESAAGQKISIPENVCEIIVKDANEFLKEIVGEFYGDPSENVKVIGITGTNGKTTVSYLIESILRQARKKTGVIGTINYRIEDKIVPAVNTTPGIIDTQHFLSELSKQRADYCVMEVSSHALVQERVGLVSFRTAVFTNLQSDHLDYHANQEDYFKAKSKLFVDLSADAASVINIDDLYGQRLIRMTKAKVCAYGIQNQADYKAVNIKRSLSQFQFTVNTPVGQLKIETKLIGVHNVYNILAAVAVCTEEGIPLDCIRAGIAALNHIPGRLEKIETDKGFHVFVDYAHTEDGLKNVLLSLKEVSEARLIVVFGCGGDRDKGKRAKMGRVARDHADYSILTNDNPRNEEGRDIIDQIIVGFDQNNNYDVILDRKAAIKRALDIANAEDVVLVAGKGHEDYQIFRNETVHFDDRECVRNILNKARV